jgi:DNA segregation ATPase FtsK/SpoIIIE-like protein
MDNEKSKDKSVKNIVQAIGFGLLLFVAVIWLSPATRLWGLGYGLYYFFGPLGFWAFLPFCLVLDCALLVKGCLPRKVFSWRIYLGFFLFFSALAGLLSDLSYAGKESPSDYSLFFTALHAYSSGNASGLYTATDLGGGIYGYFLSSCLIAGGRALVLALTIVFLCLGAALAFYPLEKKGVLALMRISRTAKATSASRKERAAYSATPSVSSEPLDVNAPLSSAPRNEFYIAATPSSEESPLALASPTPESEVGPAPRLAQPHEEENASEPQTRSAKYAAGANLSLPQERENPEITPMISPREMARAGLQEAVFIPDAASAEAYERSLIEKRQPSAVIPPSASNSPVSNEVVIGSVPPVAKTPAVAPQEKNLSPNEVSFSAAKPQPTPVIPVTPVVSPSTPLETLLAPEPVKEEPASPSVAAYPIDATPVVATPLPEVKPANEVSAATPIVTPKSKAETPKIVNEKKPAPLVEEPAPEKAPEPVDPNAQPKASPRPPYHFPSLDMLTVYPSSGNPEEKEAECRHRQDLINQALNDLKVGAQAVSFTIGPSVTRYDLQTNPDVSVASIGRFIQDISVRLGGVAARFEEVVRGKSTSGLEIANTQTTIVSLKEMVEHLPSGDRYNMCIPFGKSISGDYVFADLSDFPHMLVAGTTGSGKSIFMHGVIMSLIMRNRPEDLKLVVVDPKRVEMGKYKELPHLLCPIIKEPSEAKVCFQKLIDEMERRYTLFELAGVSNIRQFNKEYAPAAGVEKLPFIVVVIDEYADLVDSCKDIGDGVVRLAQKARAAGIHLVIATQRPSVQVITGVIKANLPVRVALSMNNAVDSQTILGVGGAEELVGHGDMLVDCSLVARNGFTRCQGCLVDNEEIRKVVEFIKAQESVHYDPRFMDLVDHEAEEKAAAAAAPLISKSEMRQMQGDDMYEQIKEDIMAQEYTSISRIQRSYGVGFPRAGKIFARLQADGIVAAAPETSSSSKGCKVLIHSAEHAALNAEAEATPGEPGNDSGGGSPSL